MAVLMAVPMLVLGTNNVQDAEEAIADALPGFVIFALRDSRRARGTDMDAAHKFGDRFEYGYVGPHDDGDLQKRIDEGRKEFADQEPSEESENGDDDDD
jgi:hypothetical protein